MNGFYDTQYSAEDLQQEAVAQRRNQHPQSNSIYSLYLNQNSTNQIDQTRNDLERNEKILPRESYDESLTPNNTKLHRTQTISRQYISHGTEQQSPMEMGSKSNALGDLNEPQFGTPNRLLTHISQRHPSGMLEIDGYGGIQSSIGMQTTQMSISLEMHEQNAFNNANLIYQNTSYTPTSMDKMLDNDGGNLNTYLEPPNWDFGDVGIDQMGDSFIMSSSLRGNVSSRCGVLQNRDESNIAPRIPQVITDKKNSSNSRDSSMSQCISNYGPPAVAQTPPIVSDKNVSFPTKEIAPPTWPEAPSVTPLNSQLQEIYCESGFDMLGALAKVASRKNPEINLGKVDLSCAFAVCDASQYDCPIIYVSEVFERLTGYNKYEVKGQNCRFLQSPDGKVQAGVKRQFVDNDAVIYLREKISQSKEAQRSLINYRKGGQPFMNLLTIIPITGEDNETFRYFIGFQVDLVQKPTSVEGKNSCGAYTVNYSQGMLPRYVWQPPDGNMRPALENGQTISREDVSTVLASIKTGTESELTKRMWGKVLLENTDDVVHVLSLKGLFLYLSPSSRHVLEYDSSELVGKALSAVCHPSDIVSVTRELKETSSGTPVNVIFRIRRKKSGYTWFESHGSLCVEQGKGRKCLILVGRERPVYVLHRHDIEASGGIGEYEMWNKISTSGMFLYVSSHVRSLLGRSPDDLLGTSIQALMRSESKLEFGRSLESARNGEKMTYRHEILTKRGLMMQAQTTLYPGDSSNGFKATFLVAQTKIIKSPTSISFGSVNSSHFNHVRLLPEKQSLQLQYPNKHITHAGSASQAIGSQHVALASESNIFDELKTTRCTAWQFELRQMEKSNRLLSEELASLLSNRKKRKRRKGAGYLQKDCANCHTQVTPEWRRGPSGQRDLCNSCGLRYAKQIGRVSSRTSTRDKRTSNSASSVQSSLQQEVNRSHAKYAADNSSHATDALLHIDSSNNSNAIVNDITKINYDSTMTDRIACAGPNIIIPNEAPLESQQNKCIDFGFGGDGG
ncbi:White collar 1 protein [Podosphaera aphanis]|nr:White collar 1 protein [Podosphaera aphanis]